MDSTVINQLNQNVWLSTVFGIISRTINKKKSIKMMIRALTLNIIILIFIKYFMSVNPWEYLRKLYRMYAYKRITLYNPHHERQNNLISIDHKTIKVYDFYNELCDALGVQSLIDSINGNDQKHEFMYNMTPITFYITVTYYTTLKKYIFVTIEFHKKKHKNLINQIIQNCLSKTPTKNLYKPRFIHNNPQELPTILPSVKIMSEDMYPSKSYIALEKVMKNHIRIQECMGYFKPLIILTNGNPGLGKTKFGDYISAQDIFREVYVIDMMVLRKYSFDMIMDRYFARMRNQKNYEKKLCYDNKKPNLLIIDEIDKYLDFKITHDTIILPESQRCISKLSKKAITGVVKIDQYENKEYSRKDFIHSLMKFVDSDNHIIDKTMIMFCSNNFESIFPEDSVHYDALKTRLQEFTFEEYEAEEILKFLLFYNEKFKGEPEYKKIIVNKKLVNNLGDIHISPRKLYQIMVKNSYNYEKIIQDLCSY